MVQLTKAGLVGKTNLEELARQFEQSHTFRLPRLLHPELIQMISSRLQTCTWTPHDDGDIARELLPGDVAPVNVLNFAANTSEFLNLIRGITGCEVSSFGGRVYKMVPGSNHFDSWHGDNGKDTDLRMVGMSINLSSRPYLGGLFRLRDESTKQILSELPNTGEGDAIFFRISPLLRHMVTTLVGTEPKTAFAGWFLSGEKDFYSTLKKSTQEHSLTPAN
jgi:hypothetical protein